MENELTIDRAERDDAPDPDGWGKISKKRTNRFGIVRLLRCNESAGHIRGFRGDGR
jgi:hypothetical protein